jgi:hypothetical protein
LLLLLLLLWRQEGSDCVGVLAAAAIAMARQIRGAYKAVEALLLLLLLWWRQEGSDCVGVLAAAAIAMVWQIRGVVVAAVVVVVAGGQRLRWRSESEVPTRPSRRFCCCCCGGGGRRAAVAMAWQIQGAYKAVEALVLLLLLWSW